MSETRAQASRRSLLDPETSHFLPEQKQMNGLRNRAANGNAAQGAARAILAVGLAVWVLSAWCAGADPVAGPKVYIITHVDVAPLPAGPGVVDRSAMLKRFQGVTAEAETLLRKFALESRRDPGCVSFQVLQEPQRHNHFTIVQIWDDEGSFLAHEAAAHTRATRGKLQPILGAPQDQRLHLLFE
jgi:quinol monooxygenase YgiN